MWSKLVRAIVYPHIAIMIILLPVSAAALVCSMVLWGVETPVAYISYALSAYTLTVWCFRVPKIIRFFKVFKNENKYARRWLDDPHLRVNASLYGGLVWNTAYAVFQLCLGFYHGTFWYCSLAGYYISLAIMRFSLVRYTFKKRERDMLSELLRYRACGWAFLALNLALSFIVFFMVYWGRTFVHHEITTITMAAYTFTTFTVAIVNVVRYKKYNSPVYSATRAIGLAAATVSMLTLESTMLTTFGSGEGDPLMSKIMLAVTGGVISVFILFMAVYMIVSSTKKIRKIKNGDTF
ncbi:MAG: hypothetical protein IJW03_02565 [Clostridia bacterium]|nr:hypothetical protein [Clostridia bacterium]